MRVVVPCAPTVPHAPFENRRFNGLRPSEMRRRNYAVDSDLRESADSRARPRDTLEDQRIRAKEPMAIHDTIELRNDEGDPLGVELYGLIARTTKLAIQRSNDVAGLLVHGAQGYEPGKGDEITSLFHTYSNS